MRILHIVQRYRPATGGSEKYFEEFSRRFVSSGHSVQVLTTNAIELEAFWLSGRKLIDRLHEQVEGVDIERLPVRTFPQQGRLWKLLVCIPGDGAKLRFHFPSPIIPGLDRRLKQLDGAFDIVHAGSLPYSSLLYAAWQYAERNGIPLIYSPFMHPGEHDESDLNRWYARPDQMRLLKRANQILVQTPSEKRFFLRRDFSNDQLTVLGAGVNPDQVLQQPDKNELSDGFISRLPQGPFVFQIGPQTRDKGTFFLIESMQRLWEKGLDLPLVLAGATMNDFEPYFNQLSSEHQARIIRLGYVSDTEKHEIYRRGTLMAHPSRSESFGIVFLEAWLWGKPVIGASAGGVVDLVEDEKNGFLVPFNDRDQLAQRIEQLIADPVLRERMAAEGKRKVLKKYTWDRLFEQLLPVYEKLCGENQSPPPIEGEG